MHRLEVMVIYRVWWHNFPWREGKPLAVHCSASLVRHSVQLMVFLLHQFNCFWLKEIPKKFFRVFLHNISFRSPTWYKVQTESFSYFQEKRWLNLIYSYSCLIIKPELPCYNMLMSINLSFIEFLFTCCSEQDIGQTLRCITSQFYLKYVRSSAYAVF